MLSLQIKSAGYPTKISAQARADVGGMTTLRSLDDQQASSSTASAPPTAGTASAQPSKTTPAVRNDLAKGSAKRSLRRVGSECPSNYWSALSMGDWTAAALKPLNMSASAVFIDGSKQDIFGEGEGQHRGRRTLTAR